MAEESKMAEDLSSQKLGLADYIEPSLLNALPHYLPLLIFPLLLLALVFGGWWLLAPFLMMSIVGPFDRLLGMDTRNIDPKKTPERHLFWHNLPVWLWALLWPPTLVFGMWQILVANPFAIWEEVLLVFILTMEAQAVFVVGHELVHRRSTWERRVAEFLLASGSYPQYATEHVYIHHALVGTPDDLGSAPKGESFWHYFPREVASNLTSSWRSARERLARRHQSIWHYSNPFWRYGLWLLFWYGLVFWMGGIWAVLVFVFLGLGCVFSMKIINYCQHYGLRRVRLTNGRWEKVLPRHSWDADWKFSNWMFFKMQRHSDHHAMASRHYPLLQFRGDDESPQLPGTYSDMMNLVLRPKKWFEKMDPLVDQWRSKFYPDIEDWRAYDSPLAASRPESFDAIVEIFGVAPRLANWIERYPELLDAIQDREFKDLDLPRGFGPDLKYERTARSGLTRLYWTHELGVPEMQEQIAEIPSANSKETVELVRNWSNDKAFQIGVHVIRENLTPLEASSALSNLAEASILSVLEAVVEDSIERNGPLTEGGVGAIFLRELATRECYPGMPLHVALVVDDKALPAARRLAKRFSQSLNGLIKESLLFSTEPQADSACLKLSLSSLHEFVKDDKCSGLDFLMRARCAYECGTTEIKRRFDETRKQVLSEIRSDESVFDTLVQDKNSMPDPDIDSYMQMRGGINQIEHFARFLQLTNDISDLDDSVPTATMICEKTGRESIAATTKMYRSLQGIEGLLLENGSAVTDACLKVKSLISLTCGYDDFDALNADLQMSAQQVSREIDAAMGKR